MAKNLLRVISYYVKKLKDYRTAKCKTILSTKANTVMVRTQPKQNHKLIIVHYTNQHS